MDGIEPTKQLSYRDNCRNCVKLPSCCGIEPIIES